MSNLNSSNISVTSFNQMIDFTAVKIVLVVCNSVVCSTLGLFGLGANVINVCVFARSGLSRSVNLSFFFRSLSDIARTLSILWSSVSLNPFIDGLGAPVIFGDVFYATGGMISSCTTRITICIAAYVTLERCLCVLFPIKIKQFITIPRTCVVMAIIYLFNILAFTSVFDSMELSWVIQTGKNKTLLSLMFKNKREVVERQSYVINNVIISVGLVLLVLHTLLLVALVKDKARWRSEGVADKAKVRATWVRDRRLMFMVVVVAMVVVACVTPRMLLTLVSAVVPDFNVGGRYETAYRSAHSSLYILAALDSSVNIFIYIRMSSKYRQSLCNLLFRDQAS